jgi:hypothetical protein
MSSNNPEFTPHTSAEAETDLMNCLLASSTIDYPWNPADPEAAEYYAVSDSIFDLDDWSEAEISERSHSFFESVRDCWANSPSPEAAVSPLAAMTAKFGSRVPEQWLAKIAANVAALATSNLEPVEQLVQSVGDLLSNWATDDLLVIARPYAYAMRCNTGVENPDNVVRPIEWTELSELERAKLTILIAQYAIDHSDTL